MKCTNCGHANRAGIQFCEECGTPLKQTSPPMLPKNDDVVCPKCGTKNRHGVQFCENCGQVLVVQATPPIPKEKKGSRKQGKLFPAMKAHPARTILILLLIIGVIAGGWWGYDKLTNAVDPWRARGMADGAVSAMYPELYKIQPKVSSYLQEGHAMVSYNYSTQIEITLSDGTKTQATVGVIINVDRKTGDLTIVTTQ